MSQAVAMRLIRVSAFLPEVTQKIQSRRSTAVMTPQVARAFGKHGRCTRNGRTAEPQQQTRLPGAQAAASIPACKLQRPGHTDRPAQSP